MLMLKLYTVVLLLTQTHRLMGTRVAKAASIKEVPSIGGGLENQPSSTGHVANVQSPALELAMADESWLELWEGTVMDTHRTSVQGNRQGTGVQCRAPLAVITGRRGPQKACS